MFKRKAILLSIDFLRRFSCGFCPLECFRVGDDDQKVITFDF